MHGDDGSAMQISRGAVSDRPWGVTLGALGEGARTVLLTLRSDEKVFRIVFDRGVVIAASSPVAADSIARVALTSQLFAPAQVDDVKRRLAAAPCSDEVAVIAEIAALSPEQARALRRRLVTQRAARTFSVERGEYELEARAPLPAGPGAEGVDVRAVIYTGARMNLSELRLALELRRLGTRFALKPGALDELSRYGFARTERPVLEALRRGTSLPELEANQRDLDPRVAQAVIYALASCDALMVAESLASGSGALPPVVGRPPAPRALPSPAPLARARTAVGAPPLRPPAPPVLPAARLRPPGAPSRLQPRTAPPRPRSHTLPQRGAPRTVPPRPLTPLPLSLRRPAPVPPISPAPRAASPGARPPAVPPPIPPRARPLPPRLPLVAGLARGRPAVGVRAGDPGLTPLSRSMLDTFRTNRTTTVRPNALAAREVAALIEERTALLDRGADHFTLLGIAFGAPIEDVHAAYVELSRHLAPSRLAELGISDEGFAAQRLLAQIGIAYTVLTDRILRPEYMASLRRA